MHLKSFFLRHWRSRYRRVFSLVLALCLGFAIAPIFLTARNAIAQAPNSSTLVQKGKARYKAGQFSEAAALLQQAVQAYQAQNDALNQAMTLSNLALVYQQLGLWIQANQSIEASLQLLQTRPEAGAQTHLLAQTLDVQGQLQLAQGLTQLALNSWKAATQTYAQVEDKTGVMRSQINQAQALQMLGLYHQACGTLLQTLGMPNLTCNDLNRNETFNQVVQTLQYSTEQALERRALKAIALRSLGDVLRVETSLAKSWQVLQLSLDILEPSPQIKGEALLSLGNTLRAWGNNVRDQQESDQQTVIPSVACEGNLSSDSSAATVFYQRAIACYQKAANTATSASTQLQAQLNRLSVLLDTQQWQTAQTLWTQLQPQITQLPANQTGINARLNFAQSLQKHLNAGPISAHPQLKALIAQTLTTALQQAQSLDNQRSEAFALGYLGALYEQDDRQKAQMLTQQALQLAQSLQAWDSAYLWQWQSGRIHQHQGNTEAAIAAYKAAVETLQPVRQDLLATNPDVQFSFRDQVEPVYRQLVSLLLPSQGKPSQKSLQKARQVVSALQVAELENFLQCRLLTEKTIPLDQVADQHNAAIVYPIILPERLAVIVKLPGSQDLLYYETSVNQKAVKSKLESLRSELEQPYTSAQGKRLSQEVYSWLIQPIEAQTKRLNAGVKTLVFVLDGQLRNIPMAALYDGQRYLVEKYAIALNLGLQLPSSSNHHQPAMLAAGITQELRGLERLKYVDLELNLIESTLSSKTELRDRAFTSAALQNQVSSNAFSIVHLATHGQFSSQPEKTLLQAWNAPITMNELSDIFQTRSETSPEPVDLLVLSACQTAAGDRRAVLGLAGVAVRSGVHSTIASLWYLNDASGANLMARLYRYLKEPAVMNKAEALRRAQMDLMMDSNFDYAAPAYWAPYILVGNWL